MTQVKLWDAPLRVFHWALVLSVTTALITGLRGGSWIEWHAISGLVIITLLSFRFAWLILGSTYARLTTLVRDVFALPRYLRGQWHGLGHNPMGVLSMAAMLGLLTWQAVSGLFTNDDIAFSGPLYRLVTSSESATLTSLHRQGLWFIVGLIALHIGAVLFHVLIKKDNILKPMITGRKAATHPLHTPAKGGGWLAFILACVFAGSMLYVASGTWQSPPPPPPVTPAW